MTGSLDQENSSDDGDAGEVNPDFQKLEKVRKVKFEKKVVYIYDNLLAKCTDKISHINGRAKMTHELIAAYDLLKWVTVKPGKLAEKEELLKFHSQEYVDFLFDAAGDYVGINSSLTEDEEEEVESETVKVKSAMVKYGMVTNLNMDNLEEFGLGYDCPVFRDLGEFSRRIAGATVKAAEELVEGADVAINWCGGWHHAQRSEASGFCYVNDIVLGIHTLQRRFKRVLYVDLDAHHGDGVENAFSFSSKVMTLSFHHFESGYFPGTGALGDKGQGRGKYYALNVPLKGGVDDNQFNFVFESVFETTVRNFEPDVIVVQCGADCLAKDPLGAFNLTLESVANCVQLILEKELPTLLLGGGGYNVANAARLWTRLTAEAVGKKLNNDIPDNPYFLKYGPDFELAVAPSLRKSENDQEYISSLLEAVTDHFVALRMRKDAQNPKN